MAFTKIIIMLLTLCSYWLSLACHAQPPVAPTSWHQWVVERHPDLNCPWQISSQNKKICTWPGELLGEINADGMTFTLTVEQFNKQALLPLPGSKQNWPTAVTVNQQTALVIDSNGIPKVALNQGTNIIRGKFLWQQIPTRLRLPASIGLVKIVKDGQQLSTSLKNNQLILSLNQKNPAANDKDSINVQVFRAIEDGVPLRLTTVIKLVVSGTPREVSIGRVALADSQTVYLQSVLPARLEQDGMLRVQVKPGIYQITLGSRFNDNISAIVTDKVSPEWPREEYISFIANPGMREVSITGVRSIDTSLFEIPAQWQAYPTYRLNPEQKLLLTTITRGDSAAHQNRINVNREIWLSFDGSDAISKDNISGKMEQGWRLNAHPSVQLGRATVDAVPVVITTFAGAQGVEIRSPQINLQTVSSLSKIDQINAIGWQSDASKLTAKIHLPPGWRAVYASGVDGINGTWLQKWNLWDFFWLLIVIAVAYKLLGIKAALLMTLTLVLTFHELLAPNFLWAVLLAMIAIIGLPIGKYKVLLSRLAILPAALLIIIFISFTISSLRLAVYPTLEKQGINNNYQRTSMAYQPQAIPEKMLMVEEMEIAEQLPTAGDSRSSALRKRPNKYDLYQLGDNDRVQTGPGIPTWSWNALTINSPGMVTASQQIRLWLSPPLMTAIWRIINVIVIALMAVVILRALLKVGQFKAPMRQPDQYHENGSTKQQGKRVLSALITASTLPLLTAWLLVAPQNAQASGLFPEQSGYPPEYLLKEYESRLLQAPDCLPDCVSLDNGRLIVSDSQLSLGFSALATADIAIALPSAGDGWLLSRVSVDNQAAVLARSGNQLLLYLSKGAHQVSLQGDITNPEIAIHLPVNIHNLRVEAPLWLVDGVRQGVVVNNNISLTAKKVVSQRENNTLAPLPVKPYALVHRSITLGKQWTMETRVEKLAPTVAGGSFNIKLLSGEQIVSAYPVNDNGVVNVQIGKNQGFISWQSTLPITTQINLQANSDPTYVETWRVLPSSIWHVTFSGIAPLKSDLASSVLQPIWQPWPGEALTIDVSRPVGIKGDIFTTEMATLIHHSGNNVQKSTLQLKVRASQGTSYEITLGAGAQVSALIHDGNKMAINSSNRQMVQLHPGEQSITMEFTQPEPFTWRDSSAAITLPGKTVNINNQYHLLSDRWLLYIDGPSLGASMLYWGVLVVILLGALVLPIIARKLKLAMPISMLGWVLLGLGFSTVNSYGIILMALLFFALAWRRQHITPAAMTYWQFNLVQLSLLALTFICVASLLVSIPVGLLSSPDMQVVGNGSYGHFLNFFEDKVSNAPLPTVTVYSLPLWFYRLVMLAWSLWIATQLLVWGKWWLSCYTAQNSWISKPPQQDKPQDKVRREMESDIK